MQTETGFRQVLQTENFANDRFAHDGLISSDVRVGVKLKEAQPLNE
jgi:hypothetical protein